MQGLAVIFGDSLIALPFSIEPLSREAVPVNRSFKVLSLDRVRADPEPLRSDNGRLHLRVASK
jgi:hypothetical protein